MQRSLPGGWLWEDGGRGGGGRKGSRHVVLCGAGLPPFLTKSLLGGVLFWAFEDNNGDSNRGLKAATLDAFQRWIDSHRQLARQRISSWPSSCAPWKGRQDLQEPGRPIGGGGSHQPGLNPLLTTRTFERHVVNVKPWGRLRRVGRRCVQ